jgi:homoserine dehydrogenase
VLSAVTGVIGRHGVSIESIVQRGRAGGEDQAVPIQIVTHEATYAQMTAALAEVDALPAVKKGSFLARMIPGPSAA